MKFTYFTLMGGTLKLDHFKRLISFTSDYIKRHSQCVDLFTVKYGKYVKEPFIRVRYL